MAYIETAITYFHHREVATPDGKGFEARMDRLEEYVVTDGDQPDDWHPFRTVVEKEVEIVSGGQRRTVKGRKVVSFDAPDIAAAFDMLDELIPKAAEDILADVQEQLKLAQAPKLIVPEMGFNRPNSFKRRPDGKSR